MRVALELIAEYWFDFSLHPYEYLDVEDFSMDRIHAVLEDYEHYALPIVQLFENIEDSRDSEDRVIEGDVVKFWETFSPESLSSNCGGQLFQPRPQGFEALEEFLNFFGQDDKRNDNCPTDDQGPDGSQGS